MINSLHHFEILTNSSKNLLEYFTKSFDFNLVSSRQTSKFNQYLINSNSINFLITSFSDEKTSRNNLVSNENNAYNGSLDIIEKKHKFLFERVLSKQNTVFNAALQVKDLDRILNNCKKYNVKILKEKHVLFDKDKSEEGYVECAIIESCVDGVAHSLFNTKNFKGFFLPGFKNLTKSKRNSNLTHFDHLTYATSTNSSDALIDWYAKIFNMKRLKLNQENNKGLIVKTGESGMNLKVIDYWLCAETGVQSDKKNENSFKFVISEPLKDETEDKQVEKFAFKMQNKIEENKSGNQKNQISIFLEENNGPGIQHIGLASNDIFKCVNESKIKNPGIKYFATPNEYYSMKQKIDEIEKCHLKVDMLKENHILIDADVHDEDSDRNFMSSYLLQSFTQPIFNKNTVFLELIQRVGNAKGFGAGNIKALWNAVQLELNKNKE